MSNSLLDLPTSSLHAHSTYCDGSASIPDMVEAAIGAGLREVALTSHAPLPFPTDWAMPLDRLGAYVEEVRAARERYADRIRVRMGLELDLIPDERVVAFQDREIAPYGFDFFVGSVHFLGHGRPPRSYEGDPERFRQILREEYGGDVQAMVEDYYRRVALAATRPGVAIVGHLDRIKRWNDGGVFFRGDEPWYRAAVFGALDVLAGSGRAVELNTSGWRKGHGEPYPSPWILAACRDRDIPIIVTSDAHAPEQIVEAFDQGVACLANLGIQPAASVEDAAG